MPNALRFLLLFVLLVLLQVGLFDRIHLFGLATPLVYIYFILKLPTEYDRNAVMLFSALLGLTIDCFAGTYGLHMLACTVMGFLRFFMLKLFKPRDVYESLIPGVSSFGTGYFFRYAMLLVAIHHSVLFIGEWMSFSNPIRLLLQIVGSFILTIIIIFAFEQINWSTSSQSERK